MSVFIVTYSLSNPAQDFPKLSEALDSIGQKIHITATSSLVSIHSTTGSQAFDRLLDSVGDDPTLYMLEIGEGYRFRIIDPDQLASINQWMQKHHR